MSITVKFTGICTHVSRQGQEGVSVVLVNAENGANINGAKIPPHVPTLRIPRGDILRMEGGMRVDGQPHGLEPTGEEAVWRLCGVRLQLEGTVGSFFPAVDIPRMDSKSDETRWMMQEVSVEVTDKEQAACYFDIEQGTMTSAHTEHGAIYGILNVETTATPALRVTCFWNRESVLIHLRPGATIDVMNVGKYYGTEELDQDYLLHYRILANVPPDAWVPAKKGASNRYPGNISIGCSNSQYP